jgi:cell division protein FtsN
VDENKNPFDELENYLKDDTTDEAQEIIDSEPENANGDADDKSELTVDSAEPKPSKFTKLKFDEWYKKPILYIAILGVIILAFLLYFFIPSTDNKTVDEINNGSITTKQYDFSVVDSTASDDTTKTEIADKEKEAPEIKKETNEIAKKEVAAKVSEPKIAKVPTGLYRESKNDRLVKGRIYFDGKQYTVQSSSWKSNFIAEREVRKLKKRGFDAFIYKVFIKSKNGTWNRVRIGYFNTQKEAEEFLKKNKI